MKIILTIIPTNLVTNCLLSLSYPFLETKNQVQVFKHVVGLVTRNVSFFFFFLFFEWLGLYFKGKPDSTNIDKGAFLDVIDSSIIVSCPTPKI